MQIVIDHQRAGKRAKRRGERGENEVRDLIRDAGWITTHRNFQSGGQGGGDLADAIPDWHIEVKFTERLALSAAWRQARTGARATDAIVIVHRCNFQPWLATLTLNEWIGLRPESAAWLSIGSGPSLRAEWAAWQRNNPTRPAIVHPLLGDAVVTVLATDWLDTLSRTGWKVVA